MASKKLQSKANALKVQMIRKGFSPRDIQIIENAALERGVDYRVEGFYLLMMYYSNEIFGFGERRIKKLYDAINDNICDYIADREKIKELRQIVEDKIGIRLKLDKDDN